MIQIRMQQGLSQDAQIIRQEVFPASIKKGDSTNRQLPATNCCSFIKHQTANYLSPACVPSILADRCYLVYNFLYRIVLVVREMRR